MLYLIAVLGGVLTIASPCVLPVLPFVLSRAGQPFRRSGLPLLAGMMLTFAAAGVMVTVAGHWVVRASQIGRAAALVIFALLGVSLLAPRLADWWSRPFVRLGARLGHQQSGVPGIGRSMMLGISTGLLWTPCAGPVLGLLLATGALQGPRWATLGLLLSFAGGAALVLALVLVAGNRALLMFRRTARLEQGIRRGLGVTVLLGVIGIAAGWDTGVLARLTSAGPSTFEQHLVDRVSPLPAEGRLPDLSGATAWLQSAPLTAQSLRGRVVLVDFWTYSCINCVRSVPYVEAWFEKYRAGGLVVVGVHTPEFAFERDLANVSHAIRDLHLTYPVAIDNAYAIWRAFHNEYWPAHYVVDAAGTIRHHHFGEGGYEETERVIQQLLNERENRAEQVPDGTVTPVATSGAQAASSLRDVRSPETYVGYERQENFTSPEAIQRDSIARYTAPGGLRLNEWALGGAWDVGGEHARAMATHGSVVFRFHARDLHLVLGPGMKGRAVRFRVRLDGSAPGVDAGSDVRADGSGTVADYKVYQFIRQKGPVTDRTFEIEFLDSGVEVFAFTFG